MTALAALALAWGGTTGEPPSPARVREVRDRILADPRFHRGEREITFFEWIMRRLEPLLRKLLGGLGIRPGSAAWWLVLVGALVVLGAILAHAAFVVYRGMRAPRRGEGAPPGPAAESDDPAEALRRAREAAARSAWREAFSWTYRAGLLALRRRGVVTLRDGATVRDFLRQLSFGSDVRPGFEDLAGEYERVVFGHRAPGPGAAERCIARVEGWIPHG